MDLINEDSVAINRGHWTDLNSRYTDGAARRQWAQTAVTWGIWHAPEVELRVLPAELAGINVVELGCGTAYFSARLARRGARPVGVDPTPAQLATARRCQEETGLRFPLIEASAESVPLPDASFDLAVSEYGASIWADPYHWVAEAARLLRPEGRLVFLRSSTLSIICSGDEGAVQEHLMRPQFGTCRYDWRAGGGGIEFHPTHGEWIRLLRASGFAILDLVELRASPNATDHPFYEGVPVAWARSWPAEEIWVAQKQANRALVA